jgi:hypothetical protein
MDHLWKSIARLGEALELSNKSVQDVRDELGDVSELQVEHNVYDVTEGVTLTLTSRPWADELSVLGDRVSDVGKLLSEHDFFAKSVKLVFGGQLSRMYEFRVGIKSDPLYDNPTGFTILVPP